MAINQNKFNITFISINVDDDGDDFSKGDIFYNLSVDGQSVSNLFPARATRIDSGDPLELKNLWGFYPETTVIKNHDESFSVSGMVGDVDDLATGENDIAGTFTHTYSGSSGWWTGAKFGDTKIVKQRLNQDGMDVTVNYKITYIDGVTDIDLGPVSEPITERNIADGGVILYQGENYNSNLTGVRLISPSQRFGMGDFNLPVDIRSSRQSPFGGATISFILPGIPPKTVSSIKVGTQIKVTLYDRLISDRHLGTNTILFEDASLLNRLNYNGIEDGGENGWNNKVMSIKVEHYEIRVQ